MIHTMQKLPYNPRLHCAARPYHCQNWCEVSSTLAPIRSQIPSFCSRLSLSLTSQKKLFSGTKPSRREGLDTAGTKTVKYIFFSFLKLSPQCESPELKLIWIWSKSLNAQRERERWKQIQWESWIERVSTLWKLRTRVHKKTGDDSRGVADGAGYGNGRTMGGSGDGGSGGYTMCRINSKTCGPKNKTHKVDMNTVG